MGPLHVSLVDSLLGAIVRLEGDALVLHTGEKPYVVTSTTAMHALRGPVLWGQVELSTRSLTSDAITSMLEHLLTAEQRRVLDELGAVENELPATTEHPAFTVIAARGGDDIWVEVKPISVAEAPQVQEIPQAPSIPATSPAEVAAADSLLPDAGSASVEIVPEVEQEHPDEEEVARLIASARLLQRGPSHDAPAVAQTRENEAPGQIAAREPDWAAAIDADVEIPATETAAAEVPLAESHAAAHAAAEDIPPTEMPVAEPAAGDILRAEIPVAETAAGDGPLAEVPVLESESAGVPVAGVPVAGVPVAGIPVAEVPIDDGAVSETLLAEPAVEGMPLAEVPVEEAVPAEVPLAEIPEAGVPAAEVPTTATEVSDVPFSEALAEASAAGIPAAEIPRFDVLPHAFAREGSLEEQPAQVTQPAERIEPDADHAEPSATPEHAVVVPISRTPRQPETIAAAVGSSPDVERLLRIAVARGASGLYLVARSRPTLRVDGEMRPLDEEPLSASSVESLMLALAPETTRDAVMSVEAAEWFRDIPELGRVRCLSFRDHRGPGVIVRMLPPRAISVEQLGLSKEIQALCAQPDGLVLVCGPRASGKSTLLAAFVDLVNRTRADHVITIERQITFVHEARRSLVSQREVRGEARDVLAAVRAALREDPDVLVIEELRSPEVIAVTLEAMESGRLVLAGLRAPSAAQALERLVSQVPAERRADVLTALSIGLRGVVTQVLLRKRGGGRVAARELLLNTPAASSVIAEGKLFQLSAALESGRKLGSVALNDALAALVREGIVDAAAAWRRAYDREALIPLLKHDGVDTAFLERLA